VVDEVVEVVLDVEDGLLAEDELLSVVDEGSIPGGSAPEG
jgi:hypothetical protein